jgi:hypothetical protein
MFPSMAHFFPRHTVAWKAVQEPSAWRRLSLSVVAMAGITGVVLRLYRAFVLGSGAPESFGLAIASFSLGVVVLCGMATLHLGNYTVRHWWWRAPLFVLVEVAAEMLTSAALLALGAEYRGSAPATMRDWPGMALTALRWRFVVVGSFVLVLAGVVQLVRYLLLKREHRDSTAAAVRHSAEHDAI